MRILVCFTTSRILKEETGLFRKIRKTTHWSRSIPRSLERTGKKIVRLTALALNVIYFKFIFFGGGGVRDETSIEMSVRQSRFYYACKNASAASDTRSAESSNVPVILFYRKKSKSENSGKSKSAATSHLLWVFRFFPPQETYYFSTYTAALTKNDALISLEFFQSVSNFLQR